MLRKKSKKVPFTIDHRYYWLMEELKEAYGCESHSEVVRLAIKKYYDKVIGGKE